jgi:hypothetical protein
MPTNFNKILQLVLEKRFIFFVVLAIVILAVFGLLRAAFAVLILIAGIVISKIAEIPLPRSVNFDLTLFVLVVLQQAYGLPIAFAISIVSFFAGTILKGKYSSHIAGETFIFPPIGYLLTGILLIFLPFDIFTTGIIATIFYAALMMVFFGIMYGFPLFDMIVFLVTILPFNYWVFRYFGSVVLGLLV